MLNEQLQFELGSPISLQRVTAHFDFVYFHVVDLSGAFDFIRTRFLKSKRELVLELLNST